MGLMQNKIKNILTMGERISLIPVHRLHDLKSDLEAVKKSEDLNGFQKWIIDEMYRFDPPETDFTVRSVLLVAIPHPAYAHADFEYKGKTRRCVSLILSDFADTEKRIAEAVRSNGFNLEPAGNIPYKRLAVRCGLAKYGRNNITYIDGLGSFFSYAGYFTDLPPESDPWTTMKTADICAGCGACVHACPTGAIMENRFLIDNERCLSFLNERAEDFPAWLSPSVHHCVYDCLQCQLSCPMNVGHTHDIAGPVHFSEEETSRLLAGEPVESFDPDFAAKVRSLGLHEWPGVPRNLRLLLDVNDNES